MNRRTFLKLVPAAVLLASKALSWAEDVATATSKPARDAGATASAAQSASKPSIGSLQPIQLPKPEKDGGKSVLAALWERKTNRNITEKPLPPQVLSNLLWAAFGVNREAGATGKPGRTAATASNSQEIDLYVALADGVYLYEAIPHRLVPVAEGDFRAKVGRGRRGGGQAPVRIIFVADLAKFTQGRPQEPGLKDPEIQKSYYNIATGLISGNIYLFAASQGLAAWFHNCDKPGLTKDLDLRPEQRVLYAQTVGYPA
jgi:hypothetical protein